MLARLSCLALMTAALAACGSDGPTEPDNPPATDTSSVADTRTAAPPATAADLPPVGPHVKPASKNTIDWDAAREDLSGSNAGLVTIQSVDEEPAEVPVLLPTGIATSQSAGAGPVFRRTDDGYFAYYPGATYNITVNGTNQVIETQALENTNPDRKPVFSTTVAGAQVWLTRYGADYVVEFECNELEDEAATCIEESDAMDIADQLIVVGSQ